MTEESSGSIGVRIGYRNVLWLGLVSFFTDFSTEMILGVLPLFILVEIGATRALLGLIEGVGEALGYGVRVVSGALSDRLGRRKIFVLVGYGLSTFSKPFFALARFWYDALAVRSMDRLGKGFRTAPRDALISDSISEEKTGRAFGVHRTLDQSGAIIGPMVAFALLPAFGVRGIFWLSVIPGLVALLILALFVKEVVPQPRRAGMLQNIGEVLRGRFLTLLMILGLFSVGAFNFSFILIRTADLGVELSYVAVIYALINVFHTAVGIPVGALVDKIGGEKVLALGFGAFFLSALTAMFSWSPIHAPLIAAIYGIYVGIVETTQRAVIPKHCPSHLRGTGYGLYNITVGVCFFIANTVFGALWEYLGVQVAFTYSMATSLVAIICIILFIRRSF